MALFKYKNLRFFSSLDSLKVPVYKLYSLDYLYRKLSTEKIDPDKASVLRELFLLANLFEYKGPVQEALETHKSNSWDIS